MRNSRHASRNRQPSASKSSMDYWMSYSDLMSGLLLVFIILLIGSLLVSKQEMDAQKQEHEEQTAKHQQKEASLFHLEKGLADIMEVRAELSNQIYEQFAQSGRAHLFDKATGVVRLDKEITFEESSDRLTKQSQQAIEEYMEIYLRAVSANPTLRENVDQIIFEGHTNSNYSGTSTPEEGYLFNLNLSQQRAYSAMSHVITSGLAQKYNARSLLAASGFSSSRVLFDNDGNEDKELSRRLEIKFRLKDEQAMNQMRALFEKHKNKQADSHKAQP